MKLLPPEEKCPINFYYGVAFTAQKVAPLTRDKEICHMII